MTLLPLHTWLPLLLFILLVLGLSLYALAASGHFPREHRKPPLTSGLGPAILYGTIIIAAICLLVGLVVAGRLIPWYAGVIGGGLAILMAPLVLQQFPDRFVDGRPALLTFAGAGVVLASLFWFVR